MGVFVITKNLLIERLLNIFLKARFFAAIKNKIKKSDLKKKLEIKILPP